MGYDDVRPGDVFIFVNGNRNTMKLLHAEEETFRLSAYDANSHSCPMEWWNLVMMVENIRDDTDERL